jgi:heme oxygenase
MTGNVALHQRLRSQTQNLHRVSEARLPIAYAAGSREAYVWLLSRMYGYFTPLERTIFDLIGDRLEVRGIRPKAPWLRQDLTALGMPSVEVGALPLCRAIPEVSRAADAWGCAYVLEGSMLGGRLLAKRFESALDIRPHTGGRFYQGYGGASAETWSGFLDGLHENAYGQAESDAATSAARETFATYTDWMAQTSGRPV